MSDLDDFMVENKPTGKSKLDIYASDILTLKKHGYSNKDVIRFLFEKKGLKVGTTTLARFLKSKRESFVSSELGKKLVPNSTQSSAPIIEQSEHLTTPAQFNWQEDIDVNDLI
jgi:hypothetical protein